MRFPTLVALARAALVAVVLAPLASPQRASALSALHRAGQTFLTWREAPLSGVRYRVYRATAPIAVAADLGQADLLGEVDDKSSLNAERTRVERVARTWVVVDGGPALAANQGLFVHTVESEPSGAASGQAYYAVTALRGGIENRLLVLGENSTLAPLLELAAPPQPVLQTSNAQREVWAHWVSDRDTPFQPALSLTPSNGFDFALEPGQGIGPRGLLVRLHPAGGSYAQGWPPRELVPPDVDVLALSDRHATSGHTFWFGAHEGFPALPPADARVLDFTVQRVLWTLDWTSARLGALLDPARVSIAGSSLGAIGGMYLLAAAPERLSAALLRSGNYDLLAGDYVDPSSFESLFGSFDLNLPTRSGLGILERTTARYMTRQAAANDWPTLFTISGRQDQRVGWASAVSLVAGLSETFRPAACYFDNRVHGGRGYWSSLEGALVQRTCRARADRPGLAFTSCTLDDDPGDGGRTSGDTYGAVGAYAQCDPATASSSANELVFEVFLRAEGSLDDAPASSGSAVLTPRRTGPFTLAPGEPVDFRLSQGGALLEEHLLCADRDGLVHTPPIQLARARREARFVRGAEVGAPTVLEGPDGATPEGATALPLDVFGLGALAEPAAVDHWRVSLAAGAQMTLEVFAARRDPAAWALAGQSPGLRVLSADGLTEYVRHEPLAWPGVAQDLDLQRWHAPAEGEYLIALASGPAGGGTYALRVSARAPGVLASELEPVGPSGANDELASAEPLSAGTAVRGWCSADDLDWYAFELTQDSLVTLELWMKRLGLLPELGAYPEGVLLLSDGTSIQALGEPGSPDPSAVLLLAAGTHYAGIRSLSGAGDYWLALDARPAAGDAEVEPNDLEHEAMPLALGRAILALGDRDLYAFDGRAGERVELELVTSPWGGGTPAVASLLGPFGSGALLGTDPSRARLAAMLTASGRHVLDLELTGPYVLWLSEVREASLEAEGNDEPAAANRVPGGRVAGRIDPPGDVDCFAFGARLDRLVQLRLEGPADASVSGYGSLLVPRLSVVDADGNQLASVEAAGAVRALGLVERRAVLTLAFAPPAPGPFFARVEDASEAGGSSSYYALEIR